MSGAISIPAEFFGLASQNWPSTGSAPTFPFGRLTTFNNYRTHWRHLHASSNNIGWADLDAWVVGAKAAGAVKGTYCLYGCPLFLASTGADALGPFGNLGECAHPSDLGQLTYFCTQFAERNISTWGRFFDVVSPFNEPTLGPSTTPGPTFYEWSTAGQFIDKLWTVYSALKAADPTLKVISPGFFRLDNLNDSNFAGLGYLQGVLGTVNTTKRGTDCYEGLATHQYSVVPEGAAVSGKGSVNSLQYGGVRAYRDLVRGGTATNGPIHITEMGFSAAADWEQTLFFAKTAAHREAVIQCVYIDAMLAGVSSIHPWSYGNSENLAGDLATDDPGVISGLRKIYNACAGKTIVAPSGITATGGRFLTFSDGSTYTVAAP